MLPYSIFVLFIMTAAPNIISDYTHNDSHMSQIYCNSKQVLKLFVSHFKLEQQSRLASQNVYTIICAE